MCDLLRQVAGSFYFLTNLKMEKIDARSVELHVQFSECGKNAKEWARRCMLLLPDIDRYKVWRKKGFGSLYEYAAKIAGLSRNQVDESLRILKKIEGMPALQKVVSSKGLWAVKPVATVATKETEKEWADRVESMSRREVEVFVKGMRTESARAGAEIQPGKVFVTMSLNPQVLDQLKKLKGSGEWEDAIKKLLNLRKEKIENKKPDPVQSESRHIPKPIERFVKRRDNYRCVVPGCGRKFSELHHADGFSRVKCHDPDRIFCLCSGHHDLAHRGLIANEAKKPGLWRVRKEPDRSGERCGIDQLVQKWRKVTTF